MLRQPDTTMQKVFLAFDLGATSWRAILGRRGPAGLALEEVHRGRHAPRESSGGLFWDIQGIFDGMKGVLRNVASRGISPSCIGIDSWSVDYGLLDTNGALLEPPRCYRDPRNRGMAARIASLVGQRNLFARTGLIAEDITTLCQLAAARDMTPQLLKSASALLFIPDLLRYWLCGKRATDFTLATTSQMYSIVVGGWDDGLLSRLGIPPVILPAILRGNSVLAPLARDVQAETGLGAVPISIGTSHDTAAAFSTQPADDESAILSSGTWSMLGIHMKRPLFLESIDPERFGYEGNPDGTVRLLCNIPGMYILEQCREGWQKEHGDLAYETLITGAEGIPSFSSRIDPYDPALALPGDIPKEIRRFCSRTGQQEPRTPFETARAIFLGLADTYARALGELQSISRRSLRRIIVIGGGSRNAFLNRLIQERTGIVVLPGEAEATAVGNILAQEEALAGMST